MECTIFEFAISPYGRMLIGATGFLICCLYIRDTLRNW